MFDPTNPEHYEDLMGDEESEEDEPEGGVDDTPMEDIQ